MGRWQPMSEPVNPDRSIWNYFHSGVGLSASFADEYAKHFGEDIGLIPCADGGTKLCQWMKGEVLFDHAVMMTKLAMRTSELAGILWHQGESDSLTELDATTYHDRLTRMLSDLKAEIGVDVPIIVGGLGDFVKLYKTPYKTALFADLVNEASKTVAKEQGYGFVSAAGLPCKDDGIHFTSAAYRELGKRYFEEYKRIIEA